MAVLHYNTKTETVNLIPIEIINIEEELKKIIFATNSTQQKKMTIMNTYTT